MEKVFSVTPLLWPVENGEWRMGITHESACGKKLCYIHTANQAQRVSSGERSDPR
jgi:hypothetical protein